MGLADATGANGRADEIKSAAFGYAWDWFEFHAKQRQQSFRFYLIFVGALLAAYYVSTRFGLILQRNVSSPTFDACPFLLSVLGIVVSFLFYRLERRNRALVRYAEETLKAFESEFRIDIGMDLAPNFIDRAARPVCHQTGYVPMLTTYGDVYRVVFILGGATGVVGLIASWPPQGIGRLLNSLFI